MQTPTLKSNSIVPKLSSTQKSNLIQYSTNNTIQKEQVEKLKLKLNNNISFLKKKSKLYKFLYKSSQILSIILSTFILSNNIIQSNSNSNYNINTTIIISISSLQFLNSILYIFVQPSTKYIHHKDALENISHLNQDVEISLLDESTLNVENTISFETQYNTLLKKYTFLTM
jgi:hypothetical protein